jgi:hypothetical protein
MRTRQREVWLPVLPICLLIPRILPQTKEFKKLMRYREEKNLYLNMGCDSQLSPYSVG